MIIIRLVGGLGNQMFQYALGRHLSILHNRELKLDISGYAGNVADPMKGVRVFSLQPFNIQGGLAAEADLTAFSWAKKTGLPYKLLRRVNQFGNYRNKNYIVEPSAYYFKFDEQLLRASLKNPVYIEGYWQTEKYFVAIADTIRQDFSFKEPAAGKNKEMIDEINRGQSVCLHIRHGDNATAAAKHHGVLSMEYYKKAVEMLADKVKSPEFFVFSDDPDWARSNLKLDHQATFVSHNGDAKNYEDLRLMVACKHHIIGNSTFSWWGAWLGKKPGQMVFAPKKYHMSGKTQIADLYPETWQVI